MHVHYVTVGALNVALHLHVSKSRASFSLYPWQFNCMHYQFYTAIYYSICTTTLTLYTTVWNRNNIHMHTLVTSVKSTQLPFTERLCWSSIGSRVCGRPACGNLHTRRATLTVRLVLIDKLNIETPAMDTVLSNCSW